MVDAYVGCVPNQIDTKGKTETITVTKKWCPMADLSERCASDCAWYTDGGCAIMVLVRHQRQKLQGASCDDIFKLTLDNHTTI